MTSNHGQNRKYIKAVATISPPYKSASLGEWIRNASGWFAPFHSQKWCHYISGKWGKMTHWHISNIAVAFEYSSHQFHAYKCSFESSKQKKFWYTIQPYKWNTYNFIWCGFEDVVIFWEIKLLHIHAVSSWVISGTKCLSWDQSWSWQVAISLWENKVSPDELSLWFFWTVKLGIYFISKIE